MTGVGSTAYPAAVEVLPGGPVTAAFAAPASKSVTNRLLIVAALAHGDSRLERPLRSDDSDAMRRVVEGLGARVTDDGDGWRVAGTGGRLTVPAAPLDAGLSGTTMRFGTALAALAPGPVTVTGLPPLLRRPIGPLCAALRGLGAKVDDDGGRPPVTLAGGGLDGGHVTVDATRSSQFASALLLVAPYAADDVTLVVAGPSARDYIALTVATMRTWGAEVEELAGDAGEATWRVRAGRGYDAAEVAVEYDASAAAHLLGLAVATGGTVRVTNAAPGTLQPDAGITGVLERMGGVVERDGDAVSVTGPQRPGAVDVDLAGMPDQVTTIAALAALADGTSRLTGVAVARTHETDRLAALAVELAKVGARVEEQPGGLTITGTAAPRPARLATYDDHRLAMAFAAIGARAPGILVEEPGCVAKTYPAFWDDLRRAGVAWRAAG